MVEFTIPVYEENLKLVAAKPKGKMLRIMVFADAFTPAAWLGIALCSLTIACLLSCTIQWMLPNIRCSPCNALGNVVGNLIQRDLCAMDASKHRTLKLPLLISSMFGFVLFALYCSLLTATMTATPSVPEISTLEQAVDRGYQIVLFKDTNIVNGFKTSKPGTVGAKIYETLRQNPWALETSLSGIKALLQQSSNNIALDYESVYHNCTDFLVLPSFSDRIITWGSLTLQKGSEFKELFDFHLLKMKQAE